MDNSEEYTKLIGHKVFKESLKPFKSGNKHNTVKAIIIHPQLGIPAFTFIDDNSYVECRKCIGVATEKGINFNYDSQNTIDKMLLLVILSGMFFSIILIKFILTFL